MRRTRLYLVELMFGLVSITGLVVPILSASLIGAAGRTNPWINPWIAALLQTPSEIVTTRTIARRGARMNALAELNIVKSR